MNTLGKLSSIFTKETHFVTSCLLSYKQITFWKEDYSKKKAFAPKRSKLFPFRVDPFLEGSNNNSDIAISLESIPISLKSMNLRFYQLR